MMRKGNYTLLEKRSVGKQVVTFLAEHIDSQERRIVKRMPLSQIVGNPELLRVLLDEKALITSFKHNHIARIYEQWEEGEFFYLALEHIEGVSLHTVNHETNRHGLWLAPEYIAKIASQIACALEHIHNVQDTNDKPLQLVHNCINLHDIVLSNQGTIKITNFGFINDTEYNDDDIVGTFSPERARALPLDKRSDLFSLGVVLFILSTHKHPFPGEVSIDIFRSILERAPVDLDELRPDFPPELKDIMQRNLSKDPKERSPSAHDVNLDLERFIQAWGRPIGHTHLQEMVERVKAFQHSEPENPPL